MAQNLAASHDSKQMISNNVGGHPTSSTIHVEEKAVRMQSLNMYEAPSVESLEVSLQGMTTTSNDKKPMYMQVSNSVKRKSNAFRGTKFSAVVDKPRGSGFKQKSLIMGS